MKLPVVLMLGLLASAAAATESVRHVPGDAVSLATNAAGDTYAVGRDGHVWHWRKQGGEWVLHGSKRLRKIRLPLQGPPWGICADGTVVRSTVFGWEHLEFKAEDIAPGSAGELYWLDHEGRIHTHPDSGDAPPPSIGSAQRIALDGKGMLWKLDSQQRIARRVDNVWNELPGQARELLVSPQGEMHIITPEGGLASWQESGQQWQPFTDLPGNLGVAAIGSGNIVWMARSDGAIFARGTITEAMPMSAAAVADSDISLRHASSRSGSKIRRRAAAAFISLFPEALRTDESPFEFMDTGSHAARLAIGADGSIFALGSGSTPELLRWSNAEQQFKTFPGQLTRIAVDPMGRPWGINALGRVFRHTGNDWQQVSGSASDLSIGANGDVVRAAANGDLALFDETSLRFSLTDADAGAVVVAVAPDGIVWTLLTDNTLAQCDAQPCRRLPQKVKSLAIGPDGSLFVVDLAGRLLRLRTGTEAFETIPVLGLTVTAVAVGPRGRPWVITDSGRVYAAGFFERDESLDDRVAAGTLRDTVGTGETSVVVDSSTSSFTFRKFLRFSTASVQANQIDNLAAGQDGRVFMVVNGGSETRQYNKASKTFQTFTNVPAGPLRAVRSDAKGKVWALDGDNDGMVHREISSGTFESIQFAPAIPPPQNVMLTNRSLAIGKDGSVYVINSAGALYRLLPGEKTFRRFLEGFYRHVTVGKASDVWVISAAGVLMQVINGMAVNRPDPGQDSFVLSVGGSSDGSIWVAKDDGQSGTLCRWNAPNQSLDCSNAIGTQVEVTANGKPVFIDTAQATDVYFVQ